MDTITVIFTGLMIFETNARAVYPLMAERHELKVRIAGGEAQKASKVEFHGLVKGQSDFQSLFPVLSLSKLAGESLKLKTRDNHLGAAISISFAGTLQGYGEHDECVVDDQNKLQTWMSVRWEVDIDANPGISVDGHPPTALKKGDTVYITNERDTSPRDSDLPMYEMAVVNHAGNSVKLKTCKEPKRVNNPVNCPPVSLK